MNCDWLLIGSTCDSIGNERYQLDHGSTRSKCAKFFHWEVIMSRSTHILFGVILIAAIQTASAEPQTNVAATSAGP